MWITLDLGTMSRLCEHPHTQTRVVAETGVIHPSIVLFKQNTQNPTNKLGVKKSPEINI